MIMKNKTYYNIGLLKNILICLYDLMLLFSVLFFMSIPAHIFSNGDVIINNHLYQIYLLIIIILYYSWFWIKHNQTLGMKSWKTFIVNDNDDFNITFYQCILRILFALLGGHLLLLFNKRSLQDIISKTKIIKD
jgi:uncharacterized RDD family membrane protein YckC